VQAFTWGEFARFCDHAARRPVFTVADYLAARDPLPPFVVLRLDVDYREAHALALARIAAEHGLRGSFYFRRHVEGFPLAAMHAIEDLGHEIGYHFETLDTCGGDVRAAADLFLRHLDELRAEGFAVTTAAAHGSQPVAPTYQANFDLFTLQPDLWQKSGLLGETTLSVDFSRVVYISDALWRWRRYDGYRRGASGEPTAMPAILRAITREGVVINFHPHQWFATLPQAQFYRARNRIGRVVKSWLRVRPRLGPPMR